jgi:hypothetical protein
MLGIGLSFLVVYSVLLIVWFIQDYKEAEKANKKFWDENDYYL